MVEEEEEISTSYLAKVVVDGDACGWRRRRSKPEEGDEAVGIGSSFRICAAPRFVLISLDA